MKRYLMIAALLLAVGPLAACGNSQGERALSGGAIGAGVGAGGAALTGGVLLAQLAALLLGGAAPDPRVLVGGEGELQAVPLSVALAADGLGVLDLLDGRTGGADREEQVRVGVAAGGRAAPFVRCDGEREQVRRTQSHVVPPDTGRHDSFVTRFTYRSALPGERCGRMGRRQR